MHTASIFSATNTKRPLFARVAMMIAVVALGACSDSTTAPRASSPFDTMQMAPAVFSNSSIDFKNLYPKLSIQVPSVKMRGDTTIQTFTVNPLSGKIIVFGKTAGDVIAMPANTICDPTKTLYAPTEWLKPCTLAKMSISFEVKSWSDAKGVTHADFSPDVRFDPSAPEPVRLYLQAPTLTSFGSVFIPYCNMFNVCVNESLTDSKLETYVSPLSGGGYWVYRTLRHFSGYTVLAD